MGLVVYRLVFAGWVISSRGMPKDEALREERRTAGDKNQPNGDKDLGVLNVDEDRRQEDDDADDDKGDTHGANQNLSNRFL